MDLQSGVCTTQHFKTCRNEGACAEGDGGGEGRKISCKVRWWEDAHFQLSVVLVV
jgi:hypothetical protein